MIIHVITLIICIIILGILTTTIYAYNRIHNTKTYNLYYNEEFGIPLIKVRNNNQDLYFVVDTGASYSTLNTNSLSNIEYNPLNINGNLFGIDGNLIDVSYISCEFFIENTSFIHNFQILDLSNMINQCKTTYNIDIVGVLGSSFLKENNLSVDLKNNILYKQWFIW